MLLFQVLIPNVSTSENSATYGQMKSTKSLGSSQFSVNLELTLSYQRISERVASGWISNITSVEEI